MNPQRNHLLAALPKSDFERLAPQLRLSSLSLGEALYESGTVMRHVYFPVDSIVSLLNVMANGASAEIAVVGNDGVVGVSLFMGGETTPSRAVVQSAGQAYRMDGDLLKSEFNRAGALQHLLLRYTQALLTQMAQTAVCNRHHSLDQQLCRWLLREPRSPADTRIGDDAGFDRQHARCAPRRRHRGRRKAARRWTNPLQPGPYRCPGSLGDRSKNLRVLRGSQERVGSAAARPNRALSA